MDSLIWNLIYVVGCIFGGYLTFSNILDKLRKNHSDERLGQVEKNNALELKVKELEGRIAAQYQELNSKLANVEKTLAEDKAEKLTFESRVLTLLDKTDIKMERLQDMMLRIFVENNQKQ